MQLLLPEFFASTGNDPISDAVNLIVMIPYLFGYKGVLAFQASHLMVLPFTNKVSHATKVS